LSATYGQGQPLFDKIQRETAGANFGGLDPGESGE
jgi:hypothetical protein